MRQVIRQTICVVTIVAGFVALGSGSAHAQMRLDIGPGLERLAIQQWTSEAKVDLPDVLVRVRAGACPGRILAVGCAGTLSQGGYDVTINLDRLPELGIGFYRATWFHELGHVVDHAYFGSQTRADLTRTLGYPDDRGWSETVKSDPALGIIGPAPAEWFAVSYAACAWGPDIPDEYTTYGFTYTYSQVTNICQLVQNQISGRTFSIPPLPSPPAPCAKRCRVTLNPERRFVSKARFAAGSIRVHFPSLNRTLPAGGCRRVVRLAKNRKVRVDACGERLSARYFGKGSIRLQFWGAARQGPTPLPALSLTRGGSTEIVVQNPTAGNLPLQAWVDQAAVPTPRTEVRATYRQCVQAYRIVCASSPFGQPFHFLSVDVSKLGQVGFEPVNYRAWLYRELGSIAADAFLGPQLRQEATELMAYPPGRGWNERKGSAAIVASPSQFFAEAFSTCAWGSTRPASSIFSETPHSYEDVAAVCRLISRISR